MICKKGENIINTNNDRSIGEKVKMMTLVHGSPRSPENRILFDRWIDNMIGNRRVTRMDNQYPPRRGYQYHPRPRPEYQYPSRRGYQYQYQYRLDFHYRARFSPTGIAIEIRPRQTSTDNAFNTVIIHPNAGRVREAVRERLQNEHTAIMAKANKFANEAKKRVIFEKSNLGKLQLTESLKLSKEKILSESAKTAAAFSILNEFYEQAKEYCTCPFSLCLLDNPVIDIYGDAYSKECYDSYKKACKEKVDNPLDRRHDPEFTFPDSPLTRLPMLCDPKKSNVVHLIVDKLNSTEEKIAVDNPAAFRKNVEILIDLYNYVAKTIYDYRLSDMSPNNPVKNIIENLSKVATEIAK